MLRPVENQLAVWNVDQRAQQTRDPSASLAQGLQQAVLNQEEEERKHRIQKSSETDGEVRVRPDQEKRHSSYGEQKERDEAESHDSVPSSEGGFDFYA